MSWRYVLEEPPVGTEQLRCGHCERVEPLVRHKVTAHPENEPGQVPTPTGEVLLCPACKEMSRPASRFARGLGLFCFVPSTVALLYGVARGVWSIYDMIAGLAPVGVGKIVFAVAMIPLGGFLSYRALRIVVRALSPGWLLPLRDLRGRRAP